MTTLHGEIRAGWGHFATPIACTPTHLLVAHHMTDAELVVLRRDGTRTSRHLLGGSSGSARTLAISPDGDTMTVLGQERVVRISLSDGRSEVTPLPPAPFRDVAGAGGRILLLDEGRFLRAVEGDAVRDLHTLDARQPARVLGSTGRHVVMSAGRRCVAIDARDGSVHATLPLEGELDQRSVSVGPDYVVHARVRETREGAVSTLRILDGSSFERIAEWSWRGTAHQLVATRPLIAALLLSVEGGPVLRVRSLSTHTELDIPLSGPVGTGFSRATPDLAGTGGVVVALHDGLTAITELPTGLARAHLVPEAADPEWRCASALGGALAARDGSGRILSIDLPRDDTAREVRLSIGTLPPPTGGAVAKVVYAGVTSIAMVQHPTHGRLNISQPEGEARLATGDEIVIDKVETRGGGVVSVLAWHRAGASRAPTQHAEAAWRWGAQTVAASAPNARGPKWGAELAPHARLLGRHGAELERIAKLHDESALFRSRFAVLGIELALGWAEEEGGIAEMMELPEERYFLFARHLDEPVYYAVDQAEGSLVELTWQDGETEPVPGPDGIAGLIEERIAFVLECDPDDDEQASIIAQLRADLAESSA
jgi:hypothetical protein